MPNIHRDMKPGNAMTFHISIGMVDPCSITLRFWAAHTLAPEASLPPLWPHLTSSRCALVTVCARAGDHNNGLASPHSGVGQISWFLDPSLPTLAHRDLGRRTRVGRRETLESALLIAVNVHVAAALTDLFLYRDRTSSSGCCRS